MPTGLDFAVVAAPAVTALAGAYAGARWQGRSEADAELRALLDDAITALQRVAQKLDAAQRTVPVEGVDSATGLQFVEALDAERSEAEQIADRIMGRTEPGAPIYEHYVQALGQVEHCRGVLILLSARWDAAEAETLRQEAREVLKIAGENFKKERYLFRRAVQDRLAPRRWLMRTRKQPGSIEPPSPV